MGFVAAAGREGTLLIPPPENANFPPCPFSTFRFPSDRPVIKTRTSIRVAEIIGGSVAAASGVAVMDQSGALVPDFSHGTTEPYSLPLGVDYRGRAGVLIANWGPHNYCHALLELAPRVHVFEANGLDVDVYFINDGLPEYVLNVIRHYAAGKDLIPVPKGTMARADRLVTCSPLHHPANHASPEVVEFLRSDVLTGRERRMRPTERVYVERPAGRRGIENAAEVKAFLESRGFRSVSLERLPFVEQARLMARAQIVVAPHGAGLGNIVFCQPGSAVIEIFQKSYGTPAFWILAAGCGVRYYPLIDARWQPTKSDPSQKFDSILVDVDALKIAIDRYVGQ